MIEAGFSLLAFDHLPSTSDHAKLLAADGAPDRTVVLARSQSAGRGRQGRQWQSPPGNVYLSVILRPRVSPARATELGFVTAVAVADCIDSLLPEGQTARLKWPNDILVGGLKLGGILLEAQSGDDGLVEWVVIGIGVNVASYPDVVPATSLHALGASVEVDAVVDRLVGSLSQTLALWQTGDFPEVRRRWLTRAHGMGMVATVAGIEGVFHDLDHDGAMLLRRGTEIRRITAGDVQFAA